MAPSRQFEPFFQCRTGVAFAPKDPMGVWLATALLESEVADPPTLEATMPEDAPRPAQAAIRTDLGAIFVSMELSRRAWLITSLSPRGGEKMSKHSV
jgi:hypothetical protein